MWASSAESRGAPRARARVAALLVLVAGVAFVAGGCSSTKCDVVVESTPDTNNGKPFYAVVRNVEQATFVVDTYETVSGLVFAEPPDKTVLSSTVIYPGLKAKLTFTKPEAVPIGVYFLFTQPGERWKVSKAPP